MIDSKSITLVISMSLTKDIQISSNYSLIIRFFITIRFFKIGGQFQIDNISFWRCDIWNRRNRIKCILYVNIKLNLHILFLWICILNTSFIFHLHLSSIFEYKIFDGSWMRLLLLITFRFLFFHLLIWLDFMVFFFFWFCWK